MVLPLVPLTFGGVGVYYFTTKVDQVEDNRTLFDFGNLTT